LSTLPASNSPQFHIKQPRSRVIAVMSRNRGFSFQTRNSAFTYARQSQASQVQTSPSQSGHSHASQLQGAAFASAPRVSQQEVVATAAAASPEAQPHTPHSHPSPHEQFSPSQSGQRQSTQPHAAAEDPATAPPANENTSARATAKTDSSANFEKDFMELSIEE
jgi:hypothetical protein